VHAHSCGSNFTAHGEHAERFAGVSTNDLVEAARELQVLLDHRASFGLGPLLHAQPYFSSRNAPADRPPTAQCAAMLGPSTPVLQVQRTS
jgi:hypothetical protein